MLHQQGITYLDFAITECTGRKYGAGCLEDCGYCVEYEKCHHISGKCLNGCKEGYQGLTCTEGNQRFSIAGDCAHSFVCIMVG